MLVPTLLVSAISDPRARRARAGPVKFTTHPLAPLTHYRSLFATFPKSVPVVAEDVLEGELVLSPGDADPRDLQLQLEAEVVAGGTAGGRTALSASFTVSHLLAPVAGL